MTPVLWGYFRSSAAYRVRIAFNVKGISHEHRFVHLAKGEQGGRDFAEVNPQALVPVLETEEGGERAFLAQSMAILEYLEETHREPPLLPGNALRRAKIRAAANMVACDIHPLNNLRVLKYLKHSLGHDQEAIDTWYRHWVVLGFEALEKTIEGSAFCFGDQPTLADVCLMPQIYNARRFEVALDPYPKIRAVEARCAALAAFADAHPDKQPDAA
jgi:maleylacetoacetate isomerase